MTIRERIANWLTRGELEQVRRERDVLMKVNSEFGETMQEDVDALMRIVSMETPNCAPVGKKMARVARGALGMKL